MKKLFTLVLALMLIASMTATAFAADGTLTSDINSETIDVNVTYNDGTFTPTVYSVDIAWEDMNFTYETAGTKVWNPTTHEYEEQTISAWEKDSANVTVTNHSNAGITVYVNFTPEGETGVTGKINDEEFTLPSAEGREVTSPFLKYTVRLEISGKPTNTAAENLKIGTVTVKFE